MAGLTTPSGVVVDVMHDELVASNERIARAMGTPRVEPSLSQWIPSTPAA